jgi:elongator complex protein 3
MKFKDEADRTVKALTEIAQELIRHYQNKKDIEMHKIRNSISSKFGLKFMPKLVDIISAIPESWKSRLLPIIKCKPIRTASGIAVVAVMSKPHRCPHIATTGNICVYCPGGPDSDFEYST